MQQETLFHVTLKLDFSFQIITLCVRVWNIHCYLRYMRLRMDKIEKKERKQQR